MKRGCPQI